MRTSLSKNGNTSNRSILLATTFCTLFLTSCGGSSSNGSTIAGSTGANANGTINPNAGVDTGSTTSGGTIGEGQGPMVGRIDIVRSPNTAEVRAYFQQYSGGLSLTLDDVLGAIQQPVGTCRESVFIKSDIPQLATQEEFFDFDSSDAGDVITVTSPTGSWLSMLRNETNGFFNYQPEIADGAAFFPVPDGLTIDVPGADFPAFANVAVGNVTNITGESMQNNAQLTWDAGTAANEIEFALGSLSSTFQTLYTYCRLADTGSFELPANVQATITNAAEFGYSFTRLATTVVRKDNAAFIVVSRSKLNF